MLEFAFVLQRFDDYPAGRIAGSGWARARVLLELLELLEKVHHWISVETGKALLNQFGVQQGAVRQIHVREQPNGVTALEIERQVYPLPQARSALNVTQRFGCASFTLFGSIDAHQPYRFGGVHAGRRIVNRDLQRVTIDMTDDRGRRHHAHVGVAVVVQAGHRYVIRNRPSVLLRCCCGGHRQQQEGREHRAGRAQPQSTHRADYTRRARTRQLHGHGEASPGTTRSRAFRRSSALSPPGVRGGARGAGLALECARGRKRSK